MYFTVSRTALLSGISGLTMASFTRRVKRCFLLRKARAHWESPFPADCVDFFPGSWYEFRRRRSGSQLLMLVRYIPSTPPNRYTRGMS